MLDSRLKIILSLVFILMILSACVPYMPYYRMESFTEEQMAELKATYEIPDDVHINPVMLTVDSAWQESSAVLIFTTEDSEREKISENLPFGLEWDRYTSPKTIVFNNVTYSLSRKASYAYNSVVEFLPEGETEMVLYRYELTDRPDSLFHMVKEYGENLGESVSPDGLDG